MKLVLWVNDTSILVSFRQLVTFLFGKDFEEFEWCKVLTIEVSHIFHGKPWLFYRRVQHGGYESTYTLMHSCCKKILHPMKDVPPIKKLEKAQPKKVFTMRQFEKGSMKANIIFALMAKEVDEFKEKDKEYPAFSDLCLQNYLIHFLLCMTYNLLQAY